MKNMNAMLKTGATLHNSRIPVDECSAADIYGNSQHNYMCTFEIESKTSYNC